MTRLISKSSRATRGSCFPLLFFTAFLFSLRAPSAQPPPATGTPPFGSFAGGPDIIDLANLNSHITVPILHKAGRGGFNFTYDLSYDSSVWFPSSVSGTNTWTSVTSWGWRGQTELAVGYVSYKAHSQRCPVLGDGNPITYAASVYPYMFELAHPHAHRPTLA